VDALRIARERHRGFTELRATVRDNGVGHQTIQYAKAVSFRIFSPVLAYPMITGRESVRFGGITEAEGQETADWMPSLERHLS